MSMLVSFVWSGFACAVEKNDISNALKKAYEQHITAMDKEDNAAIMKSFHGQSPAIMQITQLMQQMFPVFDLKSELLNFKYIGLDGEYAIARVEQKSVKVSGPMFQDNITDTIFIFRQELGVWKLWQAAPLDIKFL